MSNTIIKSKQKLSPNDRLETKYKVTRSLFLAKLLEDSLIDLGQNYAITEEVKLQAKMLEDTANRYIEGVVPLCGEPTSGWLERQFQTEKFKQDLPTIMTTMSKVQGEVPEMIYKEVANLFYHLIGYSTKGKKLDYEKYALLFQFMTDEMDAELSKGITALSVAESSTGQKFIVFNLCKPVSNFKEEVSYG